MQPVKPSFLSHDHALLTAMVQEKDPESAVSLIRNSSACGAEAYGIQLCSMERQYRNEKDLRHVFSRCGSRPIYVTNYRYNESTGMSDDELMEEEMLALKCGAQLIDVMGDMYCPDPIGITFDRDAAEKQKEVISRIHENGGEVLMSSHTWRYMEPEQVLEIAFAQQERGADIVKIVTCANTKEQLLTNFNTMTTMEKVLDVPFLFLSNGAHCKMQRICGPYFGNCMVLCMYEYHNHNSREQPVLRSAKLVMDNIDWDPYREE